VEKDIIHIIIIITIIITTTTVITMFSKQRIMRDSRNN